MMQFIEECLTPIYKIHWLETIHFDPKILFNMRVYIAMNDNRLLKV